MADDKETNLLELLLCGENAPRASRLVRLIYAVGFSVLLHWWIVVLKEVFHLYSFKGRLEGEIPVWVYGLTACFWIIVFYRWSAEKCLPGWTVARWLILYVISGQIIIIVLELLTQ